jgi:hypothetical protein
MSGLKLKVLWRNRNLGSAVSNDIWAYFSVMDDLVTVNLNFYSFKLDW